MAMELKTVEIDGKVYAEVQDGKPVYNMDGKATPFDAEHATSKISQLNGEARTHREAKEAAETALKAFEGIKDPAAAKKALETIQNIDSQKLVDAGKVDEIKAAAIAAVEEQKAAAIKAKDDEIASVQSQFEAVSKALNGELIGGGFARSAYVKENIAIPPDMLQARFASAFKIEDGKPVAYDAAGNKIYSKTKAGDVAGFDEAIEILVDQYPYKNDILKAPGGPGTGAPGGGSGGSGMRMSKAEFHQLSPKERAAKMSQKGFVLTD